MSSCSPTVYGCYMKMMNHPDPMHHMMNHLTLPHHMNIYNPFPPRSNNLYHLPCRIYLYFLHILSYSVFLYHSY